MSGRQFGPIPLSLFEDESFIELGWEERGLLLSLFAVACYHGRFPGSPGLLGRVIAAPDGGNVGDLLAELEEAGWVETYQARNQRGRTITVGQIVGYATIPGLPRDRKSKRPLVPEWPDKPPGSNAPHTLPGGSTRTPHGLPIDSTRTPHGLHAGSTPAPHTLPSESIDDAGDGEESGSADDSTPAPNTLPTASTRAPRRLPSSKKEKGEGAHTRVADSMPTEELDEESEEAVRVWLEEYRERLTRRASAGKAPRGRRGPGFFGTDGADTLERKLRQLLRRDRRIGLLTIGSFWAKYLEDELPDRVESELERAAVSHGMPNALASILAEVGAEA